MNDKNMHSYSFKSFRLVVAERQLLNNGVVVSLTPKAFDVIAFLVKNAGHLVEKEDLMEAVWPNYFVEEANITRIIHTLRKVLGEDENGNKFIETVAKKGYRFVAEVTVDGAGTIPGAPPNGHSAPATADNCPNELKSEGNYFEPASPPAAKPRRSTRLIAVSLAVLFIASLVSFLAFKWKTGKASENGRGVSIAILPLKAINGENQDLSYRLGIAESLISRLISTKGVTVRSLTATWGYLDIEKDATLIAQEQKVDFVLSSTYRIVDGKMRVTSQLINGETGNVDDTFRSDHDLGSFFETEDAVASEIGALILKRFGTVMGDLRLNRGTANEDAYRLYLEGSYLVDKRGTVNAENAIGLFDRAIALDPEYAHAYAGKAAAYRCLDKWDGGDRDLLYTKGMEAVQTALRLDPASSEAYAMLGEMKNTYEWKFDEAEAAHLRSIEIDPKSAFAHRFYALYLMEHGRSDEAIEQIKAGIELEPAVVWGQKIFAQVLYHARRYDEAIAQQYRVQKMEPGFEAGMGKIWRAYFLKGDHSNAYAEFRKTMVRSKTRDEVVGKFDAAFASKGFPGVLRQYAEYLESDNEGQNLMGSGEGIEVYAQIGEIDKAIAQLEKEISDNKLRTVVFNVEPMLDPIRTDSRYQELIKRLNMK